MNRSENASHKILFHESFQVFICRYIHDCLQDCGPYCGKREKREEGEEGKRRKEEKKFEIIALGNSTWDISPTECPSDLCEGGLLSSNLSQNFAKVHRSI